MRSTRNLWMWPYLQNSNCTNGGKDLIIWVTVKPLCHILEVNIRLYISYTSLKKFYKTALPTVAEPATWPVKATHECPERWDIVANLFMPFHLNEVVSWAQKIAYRWRLTGGKNRISCKAGWLEGLVILVMCLRLFSTWPGWRFCHNTERKEFSLGLGLGT